MQHNKQRRGWNEIFGSSRWRVCSSITVLIAFVLLSMNGFIKPINTQVSWLPKPSAMDPPRSLIHGLEPVFKNNGWTAIDNPCAKLPFDHRDTVNWLKQRYWCDRQRYFLRGHRNHMNPTQERWSKLNPKLNVKVDYNRYVVSGPGLGATVEGRILAGHTRLPAEIAQAPAYTGQQHNCSVGKPCGFQIRTFDSQGDPVNHNEARFKARLYGTAIVDADVMSIGGGVYNVSYTPYDAGMYLIQVLLTSVDGEGLGPEFINRNAPFLVNDLIYQSEHLLHVVWQDDSDDAVVSQCTTADLERGRWVYVENECRRPYCTMAPGVTLSDLQINDPLGLNWNYVWVPIDCYYHLYTPLEFHQCTQQCGYSQWSLSGDSLGREMLQNLQMILTDYSPSFAMPKLKLGGPHWSNSIKFRDVTNFSVNFVMNEYHETDDVAVLHLHNAHQLTSGTGVSALFPTNFATIEEFARNCTKNPKQRCFYYVNPAIQREADHSNNERLQRSFYRDVTRDRMQIFNMALRDHARSQNLSIIEGEMPTRSRWQSCWDGIHYSEMFDHFEPGDSRWFGGASMMITQTFINAICNQPCYAMETTSS